MRSRALRLTIGALSCIAIGASTAFLFDSERELTARRPAGRTFDLHARETVDALAEFRAAQQGYVAPGQGTHFWMTKVDTLAGFVETALSTLRQTAESAGAKTSLDEATTAFAELMAIDKRIRSYLASDSQLMAADIVFTEGGEAAATAARHVEHSRLEEQQAFDTQEAAVRKMEAIAAAGAGAIALLALLGLVPLPRPKPAAADGAAREGARSDGDFSLHSAHDLPLHHDGRPPLSNSRDGSPATRVAIRPPDATDLRKAAQLCTALGRVNDPDELQGLLARAAEVLDASGLMLWLGSASGTELRPAVAHGYPDEMIARMPPLPRAANNAAAAAYRTAALQVVPSKSELAKGAVVAPILTPDGCVGVLSAEIAGGGESSDLVQALAQILAAQLASVLPAPVANETHSRESAAL